MNLILEKAGIEINKCKNVNRWLTKEEKVEDLIFTYAVLQKLSHHGRCLLQKAMQNEQLFFA